jgi:hypothetical protein
MHYSKTSRFLGVLLEENNSCVLSVGGVLADLSEGVLVTVSMGGPRDVGAVGEELAKNIGLLVQSRVDRCGDKDLGLRRWEIGEERWELEGE